MADVKSSIPPPPNRTLGLDPVLLGTVCCILSALCYTAANICMRQLAALKCDPMWAICVKELITVVVIGPWLVFRTLRGLSMVPPARLLGTLVVTGLAVQMAGNLSVQWAFGVVGLAITMPAIFGVMLTASAVMGFVFLAERVSTRSLTAIGVLIGSIVLLSLEAGTANESIAQTPEAAADPVRVVLGVGAACLAGAMFALLGTVIRRAATAGVPVTSIVFVITGMGVLSMGTLSVWRLGPEQLLDTPSNYLAWMLAAGTFNLVAFLLITKGLQLTTLVRANLLNASQVALGAIAGVMIFSEAHDTSMILGVSLTILGIILIGRPASNVEEAMEAV